jgi:hypothetical protein
MSTCSKLAVLFGSALLAATVRPAAAQPANPELRSSVKINLPPESPVTLVSADWGESRTARRGGALVLDVHTSLLLRNSSSRRIRGVSLLVLAQEVTAGGRASVIKPSLNVGPGEVFPVRIDLRLLRPSAGGAGPLVQVDLDGVLFDDLTFFGPNRLNSRRSMTVWELEARRDRRYYNSVLEAKGPKGLQQEILASLAQQADRPRLDVQVARGGRATNIDTERELQFAFLRFPDSPVEPLAGMARIAGSEARAPRLEVVNRSDRPVQYFEIGWILKDRQGREFLAGSVPGTISLAPGQKSQISPETSLRFSQPLTVESITGFVSQVEFADGSMWIPSRGNLADVRLERLLAPSPEEQRLTELYRKKGLAALVEELKKF